MKRPLIILLLTALSIPAAVAAQIVTREEARIVAENWITMIVQSTGEWGGSPSASVGEIDELRSDGRLLGFWCHIEPSGHIVVSLRRELAPVRATSETWDCDPMCCADLVDVIKLKIEQEHDFIEKNAGPVGTAPSDLIEGLLAFSYGDAWKMLTQERDDFEWDLYVKASPAANYQEGQVLLSTYWTQDYPYNAFCPVSPYCTYPNYSGRCAVGCVATAAAQLLRYWAWPPYGTTFPYNDQYAWHLMPAAIDIDSPEEQIEAVANLCREVGDACLMIYCAAWSCGSSAEHSNMLDAYENYFRFDTGARIEYRSLYISGSSWFDLIKQQIDANRPIQYRVTAHSVVCDGWRENPAVPMWQYHMNYGWAGGVPDDACWDPYRGTGSNSWFALDNLPCTEFVSELMIVGLVPDVSLPSTLDPIYDNNPAFPYRYLPLDTQGTSTIFSEGQLIQFLHGVTMRCISTAGGTIRIYGTPALNTRLFTRGDQMKGVRIENGGIALYGGGGVRLF